eukprot:GHVL01034437.1.p1 GENE.GHVL01034437.1~~GHVL01034437.1.p1  ORF type:complete len:316 (-),score=30.25 GHVL01034437.1:206-1114(-)
MDNIFEYINQLIGSYYPGALFLLNDEIQKNNFQNLRRHLNHDEMKILKYIIEQINFIIKYKSRLLITTNLSYIQIYTSCQHIYILYSFHNILQIISESITIKNLHKLIKKTYYMKWARHFGAVILELQEVYSVIIVKFYDKQEEINIRHARALIRNYQGFFMRLLKLPREIVRPREIVKISKTLNTSISTYNKARFIRSTTSDFTQLQDFSDEKQNDIFQKIKLVFHSKIKEDIDALANNYSLLPVEEASPVFIIDKLIIFYKVCIYSMIIYVYNKMSWQHNIYSKKILSLYYNFMNILFKF